MNGMRKQYEAAFKAKVALEALNGEKTLAQLASETGVYPNKIRQRPGLEVGRLASGCLRCPDLGKDFCFDAATVKTVTTGGPSMHLQRGPQLSQKWGPLQESCLQEQKEGQFRCDPISRQGKRVEYLTQEMLNWTGVGQYLTLAGIEWSQKKSRDRK